MKLGYLEDQGHHQRGGGGRGENRSIAFQEYLVQLLSSIIQPLRFIVCRNLQLKHS